MAKAKTQPKKETKEKFVVTMYLGKKTVCTESEYNSAVEYYGGNYPAVLIGTFDTEKEANKNI
jgi:hypothetical protein